MTDPTAPVTPRTEAGRAYLAELNGEEEPPEAWRDGPGYLPKAARRAWEHDCEMILAIEREAGSTDALRAALADLVHAASACPDALMGADPESKVGMGGKSLYDWWNDRCAPALRQARAALAASDAGPAGIDVPDISILTAIIEDTPTRLLTSDGEGLAAWIVSHWAEYARLSRESDR
jgi:hypothetical protein